jgi:hypothetical protein
MSDINQKRNYVATLYPSAGWRNKVSKMPDSQVIAIYLRETNKPPKKAEAPKAPKPEQESKDDGIPF